VLIQNGCLVFSEHCLSTLNERWPVILIEAIQRFVAVGGIGLLFHCWLHESLLFPNTEIVCRLVHRVLQGCTGQIIISIAAWSWETAWSLKSILLLSESCGHRVSLPFGSEVICGLVPSGSWLPMVSSFLDLIDIDLLHACSSNTELISLILLYSLGPKGIFDLVAAWSRLWTPSVLLWAWVVVETGRRRVEGSATAADLRRWEILLCFISHVLIEAIQFREPRILGEWVLSFCWRVVDRCVQFSRHFFLWI